MFVRKIQRSIKATQTAFIEKQREIDGISTAIAVGKIKQDPLATR